MGILPVSTLTPQRATLGYLLLHAWYLFLAGGVLGRLQEGPPRPWKCAWVARGQISEPPLSVYSQYCTGLLGPSEPLPIGRGSQVLQDKYTLTRGALPWASSRRAVFFSALSLPLSVPGAARASCGGPEVFDSLGKHERLPLYTEHPHHAHLDYSLRACHLDEAFRSLGTVTPLENTVAQ